MPTTSAMYPVGNTEGYGSVPSHKTANQRTPVYGCTLPVYVHPIRVHVASKCYASMGLSGLRYSQRCTWCTWCTFYGVCRGTLQCTPGKMSDAVALHPKQQSTEDEPVSDVIVITVAENDAWQKLKANGHDLSKLTTDEQVAYCGLVDRLLTNERTSELSRTGRSKKPPSVSARTSQQSWSDGKRDGWQCFAN